MKEFFFALLFFFALFGLIIWACGPADKRYQVRYQQCLKATCPIGRPEMQAESAFASSKCVCVYHQEPVMPQ